MSAHGAPPLVRPTILCALVLVGIFFAAPWPALQAVLHATLVLGLAPLEAVPLVAGLWAILAGWTVESTLRLTPHPGGTAWADLTLTLAVLFLNRYWPPDRRFMWWARLAGFTLLQTLLVHLAVVLANGAHTWGRGWLWALLASPLWAMVAWLFRPPGHPR